MTDRMRESLFSSLGHRLEGAAVLDLYAGSGSLGLEALSRGAASAVFVENGQEAINSLRRNVAAVGMGGKVVRSDVSRYLRGAQGPFDAVFVDPPFRNSPSSVDAVLSAVSAFLADSAVLIVHRRHGDDPPRPSGLQLEEDRRYGDSHLWRFARESS